MSTITKEFTKEQLQQIIETDHVQCGEASALARIALASLEAEPYGYVHKAAYEQAGSCGLSGDHEAYRDSSTHIAVYTATPAPVSVPDERAAFETFMEKRFKDCIDRRLVKNGDGEYFAWDMQVAWIVWQEHAAMLQSDGTLTNEGTMQLSGNSEQIEPVSNRDELPLDYLQGHKDGLEWAAQLAEANHPQTGDWLYDDPIDLARAIRKGPDMPTVQGGNSPVTPDAWISCSERMPDTKTAVLVAREFDRKGDWRMKWATYIPGILTLMMGG
ncbi:Eaa protein [Escherichia coli]|uniref:Eaa protein n=1 Tax=Escherichia coli TaxID=562 RepID=A0A377C8S0_ECOLX|nr:Eaa protein [Escherichia coli]